MHRCSIDFKFFWDSIFGHLGSLFGTRFSGHTKMKTKYDGKWNPAEGILDTFQIRGELGDIWEASGDVWRDLGGTWGIWGHLG